MVMSLEHPHDDEKHAAFRAGGGEVETTGETGAETLEAREAKLRGEVAEQANELAATTEEVEALAQEGELTPPLYERLHQSIDMIADKLQAELIKQFGLSAAVGGILAVEKAMVNVGQGLVDKGSLIDQAGTVILAGLAVKASVELIRIVGEEIRRASAKHAVNKGTIRGGADAASHISEGMDRAGIKLSELTISSGEFSGLFDDSSRVHDEERSGAGQKEWKTAMKRIQREASTALAH